MLGLTKLNRFLYYRPSQSSYTFRASKMWILHATFQHYIQTIESFFFFQETWTYSSTPSEICCALHNTSTPIFWVLTVRHPKIQRSRHPRISLLELLIWELLRTCKLPGIAFLCTDLRKGKQLRKRPEDSEGPVEWALFFLTLNSLHHF